MDVPAPPTTIEQRMLIQKQREVRDESRSFRKSVAEQIRQFAKDDRAFIEFEAADYVHRMIIYDIAVNAGLVSLIFDCQSVVYKREHYPSEDEIKARKNGEGWSEEKAKQYAEKRKAQLAQKQCDKAATRAVPCCPTSPDNTRGKAKPATVYMPKAVRSDGDINGPPDGKQN
ncbi:uncharacterized protein LOC111068716 [Drosophila obscura]|uniref:uncharacterized protein LOC111068716 n=1 Tax=Drosophila obscura TaxID=7282 RepID=UPI000BA12E27|nr:uncharacterized protein LOC111068716 [Drosophila obscura]